MMTFCTLFNVNYLDKALALFYSLEQNAPEAILYALAMDDKCYEVLSKINKSTLVPIKLSDFETNELLEVKPSRKLGEYYWTCSSWLISYVLETYKPEYCTYLDADLYIYSNPEVIIQEMKDRNASVQIVSHHFHELVEEDTAYKVGKYCVEFNTFKNDNNGKKLLEIWKKQVIDHCSIDGDGIHWGDQKYQDNWPEDYPFVIETGNVGAGVGPWNVSKYKWVKRDKKEIMVKRWGKEAPLLFYHFENITYLDESTIDTSVLSSWGIDRAFLEHLYVPYLITIKSIKNMLKTKYGIDILIKKHPGVAKSKVPQKNIFERFVSLFTEHRFFHSLRLNIGINIPAMLFGRYRYIKF